MSAFERGYERPTYVRRSGGAPSRGRALGAGSGGKSSGGIEAPNTLQSKAIVTLIDLLSEGPIGGLVNGAKSIFFNNVPLMNSAGQYNFKGVTYQLFLGTPDQGYASGFPAATNTVPVGTQITHLAPIEFTITNTSCTRATVTLELPALLVTDTKNGNINAGSVQIEIDCLPAGGVTTTILTDNIVGKCTSTYERSYTFELPGEGPWSLFIKRLTPDATVTTTSNQTYLASVDEIVDYKMLYPDSAYIALTFDSELFGSQIPSRTYDLSGILVQVPANYTPSTRTYATTGPGTSGGTWDGVSMVAASTDNPCWIALDLISSGRYGMDLPQSVLQFTKWDLYQIAQYCDGMVPDGYGNMEPRYTCNVNITSRDDAYRVLQTITSIWRGMSYWGAGSLRITADMPGGIAKIVNQTDVVDGNFTYEGTSLKTRHTMAIVNFLDPTNYWQPTPVVYQDPVLTVNSTIGPNIIQVNAIGATSLGQAHRQGNWLLDSEQHQTETVTYKAGLDHLTVRPGEIVAISDPAYQGIRFGGRLNAVANLGTTMQLQLDSGIIPQAGQTYALDVALTDGTVQLSAAITAWIQNADGTTTVTIATPPAVPEAGALWLMVSSNLAPRQFRVLSVIIPERGQVEVTALLHDPTKYARVELGIDLTDSPFTVLPLPNDAPLTPPSNISLTDYFVGEGSTTTLRTTVGWTPTTDYRVVSYDIQANSDLGYINVWQGVAGPSYDIDNLPVANYVFGVRSRSSSGLTSEWVYSTDTEIDGQPIPPPQVTGLTVVGGTRLMTLSWTDVGLANLLYYEVWRAPVSGGTPGTFAMIAQVSSTSYTDSQSTVLVPLSTWSYEVRARSTLLAYGAFSAPSTAETTQFITDDLADGIINTAKFAAGLAPVGLVTSVPTTYTGQSVILNETTGILYRWDGAEYTAAVPAANVTGELTSAQIASLNTDQLTGKIEAGQLDSASVLTENLAVGSPTNFISNSCCTHDTYGWSIYATGTISGSPFLNTAAAVNPSFALPGFGSGYAGVSGGNIYAGGGLSIVWSPTTGVNGIAVQAGTPYGCAVEALGVGGMQMRCAISWFDASGTYISTSAGAGVTQGAANGQSLALYARPTLVATAPSNAVTAQFIIQYVSLGGTVANPFIAFTQAMFGPLPPNATTVGSWQQGGATTISGGSIATNTLDVNDAIVGTLDGDKITANSIGAGIIMAGAINTGELAAGSITTGLLATNFALANYLQVGSETVNNLNVLGGSISNFHTAAGTNSSGSGTITGVTVNLAPNQDGSIATQYGFIIAAVQWAPGTVGTGSTADATFTLKVNGTTVATGSAHFQGTGGIASGYNIPMVVPITIGSGASADIELSYGGGSGCSGTINVMTRGV